MQFDNVNIGELLKEQYRRARGDKLTASVMKYYLDPPKIKIKKFKKEILLTFDEVGSKDIVAWRPSAKMRRKAYLKAFIKRLKKNEIAMNLYRPNKKLKFIRPKMPAHEYMLNDIGPNSNDTISKYFVAKMHGVTKDE